MRSDADMCFNLLSFDCADLGTAGVAPGAKGRVRRCKGEGKATDLQGACYRECSVDPEHLHADEQKQTV